MKLGIDQINQWLPVLEGKRVGLITNPTGVNQNLVSTIDVLKEKVNLVRLYSPEHGVRGDIQAGEVVENYIDESTSLPVITLYGKNKKPTKEMLDDIDVLAMDIQDVGSRLYTYLYTMSYCMQGCAKCGKTFVLFDRPNPIGGERVEGNIIKEGFTSFVGLHPIPYRYGLTIGELAEFFNKEFNIQCDLKVIPMEGWTRNMYYEDTKLAWILPSPNMPTVDTAVVYNSTCLFEGTNISEGRGTTKPFEFIGAPWLNAWKLSDTLNALNLEGVLFRPVFFTPTFSKHTGALCKGVQLHVTDRDRFLAVKTGLHLLEEIIKMSGDHFEYLPPFSQKGKPMIDYNTGNDYIRTHDFTAAEVYGQYKKDEAEFQKRKEKYHRY
jgi:uncharacterized protein YbbC (DUF1343 family)